MAISRRARILGVVVAVVVLAVSGLAYTFVVLQSAGPRQVIVTDLCSGIVSYNLTYVGAQSGFLRDWYMPTPGPPPPYCVTTTLPPGTTLNASLFFHSTDGVQSHTFDRLNIMPPFRLVSVSPSLPTTIAPGGNISFSLSYDVPTIPGQYAPPVASFTVD